MPRSFTRAQFNLRGQVAMESQGHMNPESKHAESIVQTKRIDGLKKEQRLVGCRRLLPRWLRYTAMFGSGRLLLLLLLLILLLLGKGVPSRGRNRSRKRNRVGRRCSPPNAADVTERTCGSRERLLLRKQAAVRNKRRKLPTLVLSERGLGNGAGRSGKCSGDRNRRAA